MEVEAEVIIGITGVADVVIDPKVRAIMHKAMSQMAMGQMQKRLNNVCIGAETDISELEIQN